MADNQDRINKLLEKLETLSVKQQVFSIEIEELKEEIHKLKTSEIKEVKVTEEIKPEDVILETSSEIKKEEILLDKESVEVKTSIDSNKDTFQKKSTSPKTKNDLEKFIGENLINKIGIVITVIGVAIGAKYSIEHDLVSPLTRVILGYLMGLGLLVFGIKLKKKYTDYSAVLVSGAMTILYFITFSAYSFYELIPQTFTFTLMVLFTIFTVIAALNYNRQVIAHIGLVGAYAVPFLLSEDSGRIDILFSYMAIINIGILVIAFKKYWKPLYYSAFILTWVIYFLWFFPEYEIDKHFSLAFTFLILFFAIFYMTFLAYKLLQKEKYKKDDILLVLTNSFIFYGIGYSLLANHQIGEQLLGLFTLCNAIIHFAVSIIIYRKKLANKNLFFLISGLVLVFLTIAIPVQLDGNWVTLLWAGEAALLFWIGKTKNVPVYEKLSYPLMILAFFSIFHDWATVYNSYYPENPETRITALFNINFLSSILFIAAFTFINFINQHKKYLSPVTNKKGFLKLISYIIPAILLIVLYYTFKVEIETYWQQLYKDSSIAINPKEGGYRNYYHNNDYLKYQTIWIINYTLLFLTILTLVNFKKIKNQQLGIVNLILNSIAVLVFLTIGLYTLSELRESYLEQHLSNYYQRGVLNIGIRYISFAFVSALLVATYLYIRQKSMEINSKIAFNFLLHICILWIASSELINWMDIAESKQSYKLGLSILWGVYSSLLIAFGIWKNKKYLRIGAIALFAVTLIKLFFYDISHLNTIAKTIVFVSLGILLLIISFLYNKYKHTISDELDEIEN